MTERERDRLMTEALFGTPSAEDEARLAQLLATDADAAQMFADLRATLQLAQERRRPEPPAEFWDGYADRLAARLPAARRPRTSRPARPPARTGMSRLATWGLRLALVVVLIGVGVVIGRRGGPPAAVAPPPGSGQVHPASLEDRTARYLDRSKVLLLGLVNFDPATEDASGLNLTRKREIADALVQEAHLLKPALSAADQQRLRTLVAELELILLHIANLDTEHDVPTIELVQRGADSRALLLKINLTEMHRADGLFTPAASSPRPLSRSEAD